MKVNSGVAAILALAGAVSAAPSVDLESFLAMGCIPFTSNFDDLGDQRLPQAAPINRYNGLSYIGFVTGTQGILTGTVAGVKPQSPKNVAVVSLTPTLTQIVALPLIPFGYIVATPSQSFDLTQFYLGCTANLLSPELPASVPLSCSVDVSGYDKDDKLVTGDRFNFTPQPLDQAPLDVSKTKMMLATLGPQYTKMKNVTIAIATSSLTPVLTTLFLDNIQHCNYF